MGGSRFYNFSIFFTSNLLHLSYTLLWNELRLLLNDQIILWGIKPEISLIWALPLGSLSACRRKGFLSSWLEFLIACANISSFVFLSANLPSAYVVKNSRFPSCSVQLFRISSETSVLLVSFTKFAGIMIRCLLKEE